MKFCLTTPIVYWPRMWLDKPEELSIYESESLENVSFHEKIVLVYDK